MPESPLINLIKKYKIHFILGAVAFWTLIGIIIFASELVAHHVLGIRNIDPVEQKQYLCRWVLWLCLTPFLVYAALKLNIKNTHIVWFILIHLILGNLFLATEFFIEVSIIKPIADEYYKRDVGLDEFAAPFVLKYFAYIINYFLILGIVNIYVYINSYQLAQKELLQKEVVTGNLRYQLALSQLETLKMQIHPHFLFNTHNALLSLILKQENEKAAVMLNKLSNLLRLTMTSRDKDFVSLKEELEVCDLYLDLQALRFAQRLSIHRAIAPDTEQMPVPFFILQPLLENAIVHGIERTDEHAFLTLSSRLHNGYLELQVENTVPATVNTTQLIPGIGLNNVKERLTQYYPQLYTLKFHSHANCFTVTLQLPVYER
ncbi:MAG: histidine kinase [Sediminibacterium sp.]|nr:histidine kinase [Sediminibacterium sp.]